MTYEVRRDEGKRGRRVRQCFAQKKAATTSFRYFSPPDGHTYGGRTGEQGSHRDPEPTARPTRERSTWWAGRRLVTPPGRTRSDHIPHPWPPPCAALQRVGRGVRLTEGMGERRRDGRRGRPRHRARASSPHTAPRGTAASDTQRPPAPRLSSAQPMHHRGGGGGLPRVPGPRRRFREEPPDRPPLHPRRVQCGSRPLRPTVRSSRGASAGTGTTGPNGPLSPAGCSAAASRKPYDAWSAAGSGS